MALAISRGKGHVLVGTHASRGVHRRPRPRCATRRAGERPGDRVTEAPTSPPRATGAYVVARSQGGRAFRPEHAGTGRFPSPAGLDTIDGTSARPREDKRC